MDVNPTEVVAPEVAINLRFMTGLPISTYLKDKNPTIFTRYALKIQEKTFSETPANCNFKLGMLWL
jgi:hypothetical protein